MKTLRECYEAFGGDYDAVLGRLRREELVAKFLYKFLNDTSYELFTDSMQKGDYDEALRGVHTLKGVCQNLSFTKLFESSNEVTQALKQHETERAEALAPQLAADYDLLIRTVTEYRSEAEA